MKVVINRCYGGFGLSVAARKRLIEAGSKLVKRMTISEYNGGRESRFPSRFPMTDAGDGYETNPLSTALYKDGFAYVENINMEDRSSSELIALVEEMGKAADGKYAKLAIVEIPDDAEWEISDYDGIETVEEKHRSWP